MPTEYDLEIDEDIFSMTDDIESHGTSRHFCAATIPLLGGLTRKITWNRTLSATIPLSILLFRFRPVSITTTLSLNVVITSYHARTISSAMTLGIVVTAKRIKPTSTRLCMSDAIFWNNSGQRICSNLVELAVYANAQTQNAFIAPNYGTGPNENTAQTILNMTISSALNIGQYISVPLASDNITMAIQDSIMVQVTRCQS